MGLRVDIQAVQEILTDLGYNSPEEIEEILDAVIEETIEDEPDYPYMFWNSSGELFIRVWVTNPNTTLSGLDAGKRWVSVTPSGYTAYTWHEIFVMSGLAGSPTPGKVYEFSPWDPGRPTPNPELESPWGTMDWSGPAT